MVTATANQSLITFNRENTNRCKMRKFIERGRLARPELISIPVCTAGVGNVLTAATQQHRIIVAILAIREKIISSMWFNVDHSKVLQKEKTTDTTRPFCTRCTPFCTHRLELYLHELARTFQHNTYYTVDYCCCAR